MDEKSRLRRRRRCCCCLTQCKNSELIDNLFELSMRIEKHPAPDPRLLYSPVSSSSLMGASSW